VLTDWLTVFLINLAGVLSPGPDVLLVLRTGLRESRRAALAAVAGICTGLLVHITYSMVGLGVLVTQSAGLSAAVTVAGSCYLIWIGVQAWRAAPSAAIAEGAPTALPVTAWQAYRMGFLTNVLNIKAMVFFVAVFTQVIRPETETLWKGVYGLTILGTAAVCFSAIALTAGAAWSRAWIGRWAGWIDRGAGLLFIGFAASVLVRLAGRF